MARTPAPDPQVTALIEEITGLRSEIASLRGERDALADVTRLEHERQSLLRQVTDLGIQKAQVVEDNARRQREVEHAVGLQRQQVDWEKTKAVDEAKIEAQKESLSADRRRLEEHTTFAQGQIRGEIDRFERLLTGLMERLPSVDVSVSRGGSAD